MKKRNPSKRKHNSNYRKGIVILIVLIAIVLLSFSAYVFAELMVVESVVSSTFAKETKSKSAAESGVEYVAALLDQHRLPAEIDYYNDHDLFRDVNVDAPKQLNGSRIDPAFCVVAPITESDSKLRFGLVDESSKLNLNAIPLEKYRKTLSREMLLQINQMTPQIADAILDWLDDDDEPREFGAENSYYKSLDPPVNCRNSRIDSLADLLLVRGITEELLFGEDSNHDGWLDISENDGSESPPDDNADGILDRGWSAKLTSFGGKSAFGTDGVRKIDLNQDSLAELYDQLAIRFDESVARFIVAYRLSGPIEFYELPNESESDRDSDAELADAQRRSREQTGVGEIETNQDLDDLERGGLDLSGKPGFRFRSLYDLFGSAVRVVVNGEDSVLDSPWPADPSTIVAQLSRLENQLDTETGNEIRVLVNVNHSPLDVLMAVPGMTEEVARAIIAARLNDGAVGMGRSNTGWLLYEGIVDLQFLRRIAPYITVRGDVFRVDVVGYANMNSPVARVSAVIDATYHPARITFFRELPTLTPDFLYAFRAFGK